MLHMIAISLDEQGDFEHMDIETQAAPVFIGGMIYDDGGEAEGMLQEKKRIRRYLSAVCRQAEASFPQDLHVNTNADNTDKVRLVKQKISETLGQFLSKGIIPADEGKPEENGIVRSGRYYVFALVQYRTHRKAYRGENVSTFVRDDYAGNLYIHMAEEIVERIIFHNPILEDMDGIEMELATRRAVLTGENRHIRAQEYQKLGYKEDLDPEHKEPDKRIFLLSNADIYRTAIEREMFAEEKGDINIQKFSVKSIYYGTPTKNYSMEFLYLADIICSMLGFKPDTSTPEAFIGDMASRAGQYTGHNAHLIFAYDPVDTIWEKAWRRLEEKDYFGALDYSFEGAVSDSPYAPYYKEQWFPKILEHMMRHPDVDAYGEALRKLLCSTRVNNLSQDKLISIYRALEQVLEQVNFRREEDKAVLYSLYDAGVAAYCHIGDSRNAERCFEKCREFAKYTELETYLRTRNKMVVYLTDDFSFSEALELAEENIDFQNEVQALRKLLLGEEDASLGHAYALSQYGQIASSLHLTKAEEAFLKALDILKAKRTDYLQTQSYLLHYYLEMGEKEKYKEQAEEYFGGNHNLSRQLDYLIREGSRESVSGKGPDFSMKFALYVYIKAVYRFYLNEISDELEDSLCHIEGTVLKAGKQKALNLLNGHPMEIIYKYLALIALKKGHKEIAEGYRKSAESVLRFHGFTLDVIVAFGNLEYATEFGDTQAAEERMAELERLMAEKTEWSDCLKAADSFEEKYGLLKNCVVNYMYR